MFLSFSYKRASGDYQWIWGSLGLGATDWMCRRTKNYRQFFLPEIVPFLCLWSLSAVPKAGKSLPLDIIRHLSLGYSLVGLVSPHFRYNHLSFGVLLNVLPKPDIKKNFILITPKSMPFSIFELEISGIVTMRTTQYYDASLDTSIQSNRWNMRNITCLAYTMAGNIFVLLTHSFFTHVNQFGSSKSHGCYGILLYPGNHLLPFSSFTTFTQ